MNFKIKNLVVGVVALAAISTYPLSLAAKTNVKEKNTIVVTSDNMVKVSGEINDESVAVAIAALQKLDSVPHGFAKQKPIYLFLYTPGGSIQAGFELIEAVRGLSRPVNTVTLFAASMGFQLSQSFGERLVLRNGVLMSHRAAGGFEGSFGGKAPSQLDSRYSFWLQRLKELDEQTVDRTNGKQTLQSYQNAYQNEAWWTGQQALDQGYADAIVTVRCGQGLEENDKHTTEFMGMEVTYETSRCPLITGLLNIRISQSNEKAGIKVTGAVLEEIKTKFINQFDYIDNLK